MMMEIKARRDVAELNDAIAAENRRFLATRGIFAVNLMSSPGAGKTTLLEATLMSLRGELGLAVIEGDIVGTEDAQRIAVTGVPVVQANTGGACHLNAANVARALEELPIDELRLLFIENIGNLICPASYDLGEAAKVVVLSVAEGDDKPSRYPNAFQQARALVLNKTDLLGVADFDVERARRDARALNPDLAVFEASALCGAGLAGWLNWLRRQTKQAGEASRHRRVRSLG
jgi:hydrogenase nickel incorporation protein HypB